MTSALESVRIAHAMTLRAQSEARWSTSQLLTHWNRLVPMASALYQSTQPSNVVTLAERLAADAQLLPPPTEERMSPRSALRQALAAMERSIRQKLPPKAEHKAEIRRLIMSTIWVTAGLTSRAAADDAFDARITNSGSPEERVQRERRAANLADRFTGIEQLAQIGLRQTELPEQSSSANRLRDAIAAWDVHAHRALASDRSTIVLHALSVHETVSLSGLALVVDSAHRSGLLDSLTTDRLAPILEDAVDSWHRLAEVSAEFAFGPVALPSALLDAGSALRAGLDTAVGLRDISTDPELASILISHLSTATTIAAATVDLIEADELRAPARAVARRLAEIHPNEFRSIVDPVAVHKRVSIPLPPEARSLLQIPAERVLRDAAEAVRRTSGLDSLRVPSRAKATDPSKVAPTRSSQRRHSPASSPVR